jgi:hypothetical protein
VHRCGLHALSPLAPDVDRGFLVVALAKRQPNKNDSSRVRDVCQPERVATTFEPEEPLTRVDYHPPACPSNNHV